MSKSETILTKFRIFGLISGCIFVALMLVRVGVFDRLRSRPRTITAASLTAATEKESWLNIYQSKRRIGFAHSRLTPTEQGYRLFEDVAMRINTMGMVQDIRLKTDSQLKSDMSLSDFNLTIVSGRFQFGARGRVNDTKLTIWTTGSGETERRTEIEIREKPYLTAGVIGAIGAMQTRAGETYRFDVFDPTTMGQQTVNVNIIGPDPISLSGRIVEATKISLDFKGVSQFAWIDSNGELLKQSGMLGIRMEKTARSEALNQAVIESSEDLTLKASVALSQPLPDPHGLQHLTLSITGASTKGLQLGGGRQKYERNHLRIEKESLQGLPGKLSPAEFGQLEKFFLQSEPLIQADDPKIRRLVQDILNHTDSAPPLEKVRRVTDWIQKNIQKRPVVAVPDALSTLENRMGDCNEHAMLLAALARAAGIPARVEAGLVYLNGRFFYHAWNLVYVGRWISVDALFGQLPADVTHIRLVTGSQQQQLDLIGLIGNLKIDVIDYD